MSQLLIQKYLNELAKLRQVSGTHRESVVREAFKDLLKGWAKQYDLTFIPEYQIESKAKERRYVDGALLHTLRVPFGYWEAKDEKDDLDAEIEHKFKRGYPKTNIIFDDSRIAVLIQHGEEVMRCEVDDVVNLEKLLKLFFGYERPEIEAFRKAVEQFKTDLPAVLEALRSMIEEAHAKEAKFRKAAETFLAHAKDAINPSLTEADVREMLIQHVLTGEIFTAVFPGNPFHEDNNIALALHELEATFFTGNTKFQLLKGLKPYYTAISKAATEISTHHEKQAFLKSIYENFYKVYNPKAADRLGVVYTPNEIVRFMIESADWLCQQHFGRNLIDKNVDILDPATGTGTFICELIEHFAGQPEKLKHKYQKELHANEVAILPYYVANLNIEATYAAATGGYEEFPGLCFVDTLDNTSALRKHKGHMDDIFGSVSDENIGRIKRQNSKTISVIIGNPPYNANQINENENNKNREYPEIDKRIKETYIEESTAQKTKAYDMYIRFVRWASDRVDEDGVVAFITNRSFVETRSFDGFRKSIQDEFAFAYVIDLGGDIRTLSGKDGIFLNEEHTIFGVSAAVGIAMMFLVKRKNPKKVPCCLRYIHPCDIRATRAEKLAYLGTHTFGEINFEVIRPDAKHNWINLANNDFDSLLPLANKQVKTAERVQHEKAIFKLFSLGISTNRDEWVYDSDKQTLAAKTQFLSETISAQTSDGEFDSAIKWSRNLKRRFSQGRRESFDANRIVEAAYRPFRKRFLYDSALYIDEGGAKESMYPIGQANKSICFSDAGARADYVVLAVDGLADLHFGSSIDAYQQVPLDRFDSGQRLDNITDWSLDQFRKHYQPGRGKKDRPITKEAIFHYVYGVLHNPAYREKYALNLKREFPRIPFYIDFWQWADWGKALMDLHIGYENVEPFALERIDVPDRVTREASYSPKATLKADKGNGRIMLDSETTLTGIPAEAWNYKLGNRSALEWVLDQYKEKKPKDPTIREKFNTYLFSQYKEHVVDLLCRVCTVSVETQKVIAKMSLVSSEGETTLQ